MAKAKIEIRPLKIEDENCVRELFKYLTDKQVEFDCFRCATNSNMNCVVACVGKKVAGFGSVVFYRTPTKGVVARIEDIVVDPKYRGRGVGRKIMETLVERAKDRGVCYIELTSKKNRTEARMLYDSLGFKIVDTGVFRLEL